MKKKLRKYLVAKMKDTGKIFILHPGWSFRNYGVVMPFVIVKTVNATSEEEALTSIEDKTA